MRRIVFVGFVIWLGATLALRLAGQFVFRDASSLATALLMLASLPAMIFVSRAVLAGVRDRALGAIALVAPGMLLDTISTIWFARVFPNIRADAAGLFGGWLLFCNIIVLLTAVAMPPRVRSAGY
jgi:hypothetical protein